MFVVATSKPGVFHSSLEEGATLLEAYKYYFYGQYRALFEISKLDYENYLKIVEDTHEGITNRIPTKLLDHFDSLAEARDEINELVRFGNLDVKLERVQ